METEWAAKNLEVIRTLMERSALYRRALAPIMTMAGIIGTGAAALALKIDFKIPFSLYWLLAAAIASACAMLLVRRQAVGEKEPFWSPPTKRVFESLLPAFLVGLFIGVLFAQIKLPSAMVPLLPIAWVILYSCGLHSAGAFMTRGIRLWAWILIFTALAALVVLLLRPHLQNEQSAHILMGIVFGPMHLAYGAYLYITEKRRSA